MARQREEEEEERSVSIQESSPQNGPEIGGGDNTAQPGEGLLLTDLETGFSYNNLDQYRAESPKSEVTCISFPDFVMLNRTLVNTLVEQKFQMYEEIPRQQTVVDYIGNKTVASMKKWGKLMKNVGFHKKEEGSVHAIIQSIASEQVDMYTATATVDFLMNEYLNLRAVNPMWYVSGARMQ